MPCGCPDSPRAPRCISLRETYVTTLSFPQMLRLPLQLLPLRLSSALMGARKKKKNNNQEVGVGCKGGQGKEQLISVSSAASAPRGQKRFHANEREKVRVWRAMEKEGGGGGGDAGAQALTHRPGWAQNRSNSSSQAPSRVPFPFREGAGCGHQELSLILAVGQVPGSYFQTVGNPSSVTLGWKLLFFNTVPGERVSGV